MKFSRMLAFLVAVCVSNSVFGDLIFTGASIFELGFNTTRLDSSVPDIDVALEAGSGSFTTENLSSHQINSGATNGVLNPRVFFGLRTMDASVQISNLQTSFIGTASYSGGGPNSSYTATATGETSVWRHEDLNGNGLLEGPEPLFEVAKWPSVLGSFTAPGSFNYNKTFGAGATSLTFEPNTSYVILQDFFIAFVGSDNQLDPPVVLSSDWSLPLASHRTSFDFQVVPEPNSVLFLTIFAVLLMLRIRHRVSRLQSA